MKTQFIGALLLCVGLSFGISCTTDVPKEKKAEHNIRDMVLIYSGGHHRNTVWNKETLYPYIAYTDSTGKQHWMFDGFLFLEIHDGKGHGYASYYQDSSARKEDWQYLIHSYLTPGLGICAIDDCIEETSQQIGVPDYRRRIVISLPEPIPNITYWGEINGKQMDFAKNEDRIAAIKWYIDYVIDCFHNAQLKHVDLSGFYWLAEEATNSRTLTKEIADYIHTKGLNLNWIPYWGSDGNSEWQQLNFDQAYIQPNYFFHENIAQERLDAACKFAKDYRMNMEMEFDNRALKSGGNWGYRLYDYIHAFERNGVLDSLDVAYYQGGDALYQLYRSNDPDDQKLYHYFSKMISDRQEKLP